MRFRAGSRPVEAQPVRQATERAPALTRPGFVGREEEIRILDQRLIEAIAGRGALVILVGPPGIGKSRIVEEFVERRKRWPEGAVLRGRCDPGESAPPYGPLGEAVTNYLEAARVEALTEANIAEIAGPLSEHEHLRLYDEVSSFLIAASASPLLVVIDDLQWADDSTIASFRYVAEAAVGHKILLVAAYRGAVPGDPHPFAKCQLRANHRHWFG